jgi:hypothetical protein
MEIMEGWCLSGYDGRCQWSLSWLVCGRLFQSLMELGKKKYWYATQAYNTFVRPSLKYASTVWDPHTQANINKVESIQRRAARFATNNYDPRANVTTLLQDLNWPTLQHRHQLANVFVRLWRKMSMEPELTSLW